MDCLFCKIIAGEIINDIAPQADKHYLMIPKEHYANIIEMNANQAIILGGLIAKIGALSLSLGLEEGFRIVSNMGENGCQSVGHLHIHILGGNKLSGKMA